ncbi:MAG: zinc transporter ZupT [Bacteroidales bacterium]|jgi:ZIP family zinc transporter|nr:zinc transporter ZupT [Bacteroidales bacterium]MDD2825094.1 zinc transporter ZupT [Bacteroidales bacterium]MDD3100642.1 zinc transporter ZupT [Bacteroidales bacterium]MDD3639307.1 zinc transporter ZupT [Bacteroidales bacterium]MDD3943964.1 zinc transporter ZupT [Bacteroidales bacterium]
MEFERSQIFIAFALTLFAGLATGIGSLVAFLTKRTNTRFLSLTLGFSAGVMVYISFMELIPEARVVLNDLQVVLSFFGGIALIAVIDFLIPEDENPHEIHLSEDMDKNKRLKRMGVMLALSIAIHNFPEGIAAFMSGMKSLDVGIPIALAIAIHNIPEGIAVSVPIYHATGSRKKAFWFSFLSGLAEPLGALVAILVLFPFWNPLLEGIVMAGVSGIMVFISIDELLPGAERFGRHHLSIMGFIAGMAVMAVSLLLL